ncbi:hypothetical protein RKD19_007107 [Streptomyces canus]
MLAEFIAEVSAAGGAVVFTDHREAITETHATGVHAISDGQVSPRGGPHSGGRLTEVELVLTVPVTGAAPLEVNWYALPGVSGAARHDDAIVLRVAREHSDTALLTALQHHWSVESLTRPRAGHAPHSGARRAAL